MESILALSFVILFSYVFFIIRKFGVPESLSDSYYLLQDKYPNKGYKWLFTIVCFITMFSVLIPWLEVSKESLQFLCFLSASGLGFVGAAPLFKSYQQKIHESGAILCGLASQIWLFSNCYGWLTALCGLLMAIPYLKQKRNFIFYAEMTAFLSTYLGVGIEYLKLVVS